MIKIICILLISILLDGIFASYFVSYAPFFFIISCVYFLPRLQHFDKEYMLILFFLIFDLLFSNLFLFYTFLYICILILANFIYKMFDRNYLDVILFTLDIFLVTYFIVNLIFSREKLNMDLLLNYFVYCFVTNNFFFFITKKFSH